VKLVTLRKGTRLKVSNSTGEGTPVYRKVFEKAPKSRKNPLLRHWHPLVALGAVLLLVLSVSPWSIGAMVFTTPVQITSATGGNSQYIPQIALDSSGYSHVTWQGYHPTTGGAYQIWYADNTSGSWATTQITNATGSNDQQSPQITVDSNGYSHITWYGPDPVTGGAGQIWYADNTSGWSTAQLTTAASGNDQYNPQIALDSSGDSHITWYGPHPVTGGELQIWYADNTSGSWANAQITTAAGGFTQWRPQIAVDGGGDSHITWDGPHPVTGGNYQIWYADNTSGSWATTQITNDTAGNGQFHAQIALDSGGDSHITWFGDHPTTGVPRQIWYADNTSGSWLAPTQLTTATGSNNQEDPQIAVDSGGDSHITWNGLHPTTGGAYQIWYTDNTSGSWSAPTQLTSAPSFDTQEEPQIALDSGGDSHITWAGVHPSTSPDYKIWYADNTSGSWSTPTQLSGATSFDRSTQIAVDSGGRSHTTWHGSLPGSPCQIWYSSNAMEPTVTGLNPVSGTNGQSALPVTVNGSDFQAGATLTLTGPDTIGPVATTGSGNTLNATLNLTGKATGSYKATVTNPDLLSGSKNNAFTVENPNPTVTSITPNSADNDGTVNVTNLKGTNFRNGATVKLIGPSGAGDTGAGTINATNVNVVSGTKITCKFNLNGVAAGSYKVKVTNTDGKSGEKANAFTVNESEVTTPTWFLAEGTTAWGFDCYVTIENPNASAVTVSIGYMTDAGLVNGGEVNLPANSQATVNPRDTLGDKDFSTKVECKEGKTIAVDRTITWTGPGAPSPDGHCSIGVTSADTTWYLAEGSSAWGFECWLLIQNPNPTEATAQVTYMIEGAGPQTFQKKIPGNQRKTYNMADDIGEKDASIKVTADMPIIPERAMYKNNKRSGHDSIGTTAAAANYYLAEGTTDWGFTTYVLVQNPNDTATDVTVTYMTSSGAVPQAPFTMPANSRKTIRVNDVLPASDFSTQVTGSQPIIAERAMYWGEGTALGEASHDSIGLSAPHTTFYLPDGQTSEGRETYTLVQNPNDSDVTVEVSYLTPDGAGNVTFEETVGANSRKTFSMADKGINGRAAVMVTCKTAGAKIMVERAMYWNSRGAGTDTVGGFSD